MTGDWKKSRWKTSLPQGLSTLAGRAERRLGARGCEGRRVTIPLRQDRNAAPEKGVNLLHKHVCITLPKKFTGEKVYSFASLLNTDQRLELKVGRVIRDRQNPHRVGVAKTALPTLDSNDRTARLDQI